jgi:uncharacterized membrane protein
MTTLIQLLIAFLLTFASFYYQRPSYEKVVTGNVCGSGVNTLCYENVLAGGFPFQFMIDHPGISPVGSISLFSFADIFRLRPFVFDVVFYFVLIVVGTKFLRPFKV